MRTTIRMDDDLLEAAKGAAIGAGQTLTAFIEDAVRSQLSIQHDIERSTPTDLPVFGGDGVLPGVDVDNNAALIDVMGSEL
jgi:hypothetical protein